MQIFRDLRAYEFEMSSRDDEEPKNTTLVAIQSLTSSRSNSNLYDLLTNEQFAMFVRKVKMFMRNN